MFVAGTVFAQPETTSRVGKAPYSGWREIRTEHFRIIHEPVHSAVAAEVASFAEAAYRLVTERGGYAPERVPVVIRGRTAIANGYYHPFPHHMTLFVTSPSDTAIGSRHESWLFLLFVHELTHYVHFADRHGLFGSLSYVFGHSISAVPAAFAPGWYIEGVATENETRFTAGGRGRNPFFEMQYKAPVLEGRLWSYSQSAYGSHFPPGGGRIYVAGYMLWDYLSRSYGASVFRKIQREFARFPMAGVPRAVRKVTGSSVQEIYADMHAELIRRFADDAKLPVGTRLSPRRPGHWYLPVKSSAGFFGYVDELDRVAGIYRYTVGEPGVQRADTTQSGPDRADDDSYEGELVASVSLTDPYSFDVSVDGSTIVYARVTAAPRHRAGYTSYSNLYLLDVESGTERRLTSKRRMWHPAISPDASRIVAVERKGARSRLVQLSLPSGEISPLYEREESTVFTPRISPDGARVVFVEQRDGLQDLLLLENGTAQPLYERDRAGEYFPRFDGSSRVLFSSDRSGALALYAIDLERNAADLERNRITRIARDRIGVASGIVTDYGLLYATYTSDGSAVRLKQDVALAGEPATFQAPRSKLHSFEAASARPPAGSDRASGDSPRVERGRRYIDVPKPLFWYPYVSLEVDSEGTLRVPTGVGVQAASILETQQLGTALAYDALSRHPDGSIQYRWSPGPISLAYDTSYSYGRSDDRYVQRSNHTISLSLLPWYRQARRGTAAAIVESSAGVETERMSEKRFGVNELFSETVRTERELQLGSAVSLSYRRRSAPAAIYGGFSAGGRFAADYVPALLDSSAHGVDLQPRLFLNVPLGARHQLLGVDLRGAFSNSGSIAGTLLPYPGVSWESDDGDGKIMAALGYRIPIALTDRNALGIALVDAGAAFSVESAAYVDYNGAMRLEDELFFGAELDGGFRLLSAPFSAAVGATLRVDRRFSEPIDGNDIYVYLTFGSSLLPEARSERRWGGRELFPPLWSW